MNQQYQQPDPKTIETLKAARNQVIQADKSPDPQSGSRILDFASRNRDRKEDENIQAYNKFAEEFVQKLASIDQKTAAVEEEMVKLEARRNELIKVKDKLKELDKEMSDVLKS